MYFGSLLSQPVPEIFSLFDAFSHLSNLRKRVLCRVTIPQGTCFARSTKLSPARRGYCMDGWPNSNPPCSNICFSFFFLPFSKAILKPAELSSLQNIVSSLYQLSVPRFTMAVFMCIYLHCRIHKQRDTSFELSSILWTVDLSIHLITAWTYQKFRQLDNFVTFSVFVFFGNRVQLNLYNRALSCFWEMRLAQLQWTSVFKNVRIRIYSMQSISLR